MIVDKEDRRAIYYIVKLVILRLILDSLLEIITVFYADLEYFSIIYGG